MLEQSRIVDRANAMADALGSNRQCVPDTLRIRRFAGVAGQPQAAIASLRVQILEPQCWSARLEPAEPDRYDTVANALCGEIEHWFRGIRAELSRRVHDPFDPEVGSHGFALKCVVDRREFLAFPEH